jgi:tetrahydrodipicolinate N-succinyltransferase
LSAEELTGGVVTVGVEVVIGDEVDISDSSSLVHDVISPKKIIIVNRPCLFITEFFFEKL